MTIFTERLKEAMANKGVRQVDLVRSTGIHKSKISCYVMGKYLPNADAMSKLSVALGVTPEWLMGKDEKKKVLVPILGKVAAGSPIFAQEDILGYTVADEEGVFALVVKGDSMSPRILDGDLLLVRRQDTAEDGDLIVALVDDEATCKVFKRNAWGITLVPFNTAFAPLMYAGAEADTVKIIGRVVESRHRWL